MFGINGTDDASSGSSPPAQAMGGGPNLGAPTLPAPAPEPIIMPTAPPMPPIEPLKAVSALPDPLTESLPDAPKTTPPVVLSDNELIDIKQQALQSLAPLVGQLNQNPEEKFKTTMMMLQASDNPGLVKEAYAAANEITDEKARAQALLDVVNEINYFTQNNAPNKPKAI